MKKPSRDVRLGLVILAALVLITVFAATQKEAEQQYPRLTTLSAAPDGALALKLWVQELGYTVDNEPLAGFIPPADATILFMLEPLFPTEAEVKAVDEWVEQGGTLILIGNQYSMFALADHYDFALRFLPETQQPLQRAAPLLASPIQFQPEHANVDFALEPQRGDYVTLLTTQGQAALTTFELGDGRVILGTTTYLFTNAGLKESGNPEVVLNLLALARTQGPVWFDEWHHGVRSGTQILGPSDFLRRTPVGRSLLFITFAIFITLLLQGRGFGRPVPLPQEIRRRGAIEHIMGIANLSRRAAHRSAVLLQYHNQLKRKLGQRYRLDPAMDDEQYVNTLAGYNPVLDKNELLTLLKRLKRSEVSETEMVHLAGEAAKWIDT